MGCKTIKPTKAERRMAVARDLGRGNGEISVQRQRLAALRRVSPGDLVHGMVAAADNPVLG